jgi:hypothetical protein
MANDDDEDDDNDDAIDIANLLVNDTVALLARKVDIENAASTNFRIFLFVLPRTERMIINDTKQGFGDRNNFFIGEDE